MTVIQSDRQTDRQATHDTQTALNAKCWLIIRFHETPAQSTARCRLARYNINISVLFLHLIKHVDNKAIFSSLNPVGLTKRNKTGSLDKPTLR